MNANSPTRPTEQDQPVAEFHNKAIIVALKYRAIDNALKVFIFTFTAIRFTKSNHQGVELPLCWNKNSNFFTSFFTIIFSTFILCNSLPYNAYYRNDTFEFFESGNLQNINEGRLLQTNMLQIEVTFIRIDFEE